MHTCAFVPSSSPAHAYAVRITPEIKQALLDAQAAGQPISFRPGGSSPQATTSDQHGHPVLCIGGNEYAFSTAVQETKAELVQLPGRIGGRNCMGVGMVMQKLGMNVSYAACDKGPIYSFMLVEFRFSMKILVSFCAYAFDFLICEVLPT